MLIKKKNMRHFIRFFVIRKYPMTRSYWYFLTLQNIFYLYLKYIRSIWPYYKSYSSRYSLAKIRYFSQKNKNWTFSLIVYVMKVLFAKRCLDVFWHFQLCRLWKSKSFFHWPWLSMFSRGFKNQKFPKNIFQIYFIDT